MADLIFDFFLHTMNAENSSAAKLKLVGSLGRREVFKKKTKRDKQNKFEFGAQKVSISMILINKLVASVLLVSCASLLGCDLEKPLEKPLYSKIR